MKKRFAGFAAFVLIVLMILPMLTACGDSNEPQTAVTVEVDGEKVVIDNPEGKSVAQLLEENNIVLGEGDVATIDLENNDNGFLTVKVLRKCTVTVENKAEDESNKYAVVLVGGTVEDAIKAVGIKLSDNQKVDHDLKAALEDGMKIVITVQEPENDNDDNNAAAPQQSSSSGSSSSSSSSSSNSSSGSNSGSSTESDPGTSSGSSRSVVSTENYDDPDGSGHGVKVITYSDGSQEEVEY